ncbi:MAG TPA: hypothetical protein VIW68_06155 [Candidatus Sulfotelmatobacter sp.]
MPSPEAKKWIQVVLIVLMVVAGVRVTVILFQRHRDDVEQAKKVQARNAGYSNPDYYESPKKLYPYDLKSAKQLTQQPVWTKEGYRYTYYPYDLARKRVDFAHEAGLLQPIERLEIKDVITDTPPAPGSRRQMMAVFQKDGKSYAVPIGFESDDEYKIYSDEMFYIEDPHVLYKHWSPDVWQSVDQHQVKPGMNELQADFAVGVGIPDSGSSSYEKTVRYANGGKPLVVVYHDGKAAEITPGTPSS